MNLFYVIVAGLVLFLLINIVEHIPDESVTHVSNNGGEIVGSGSFELKHEIVVQPAVSPELEAKIAQEYAKMSKEGST